MLNLYMTEEIPIINNTYTFKTLFLCNKALDDKLIFINKKKNKNIIPELISKKNKSTRILKITFLDKKLVSYSMCVESQIAFNKQIFKESLN